MSLGQKDVLQNVRKIRSAYISYLEHTSSTSANIWDLIDLELEVSYHKLPKLQDPSASIGLLWIWRQLKYQVEIYENFLEGYTAKESCELAYQQTYSRYHSWFVRAIFSRSFNAAPSELVIFEHMTGLKGEDARDKAKLEMEIFVNKVKEVVEELERGIEERGINDPTRV
ncbi:hypothetical protein TrST_g6927 [Triparma strigata]|nr:hypothetical protein TrST_g6927 [Triparma strigata]